MVPLIALTIVIPTVPLPSPLPDYSVTCSVPGTKQDARNVKLAVEGQQPNRRAKVSGYGQQGVYPVESGPISKFSAVNGKGLVDGVRIANSAYRTSLHLYVKGAATDRIELWIGEVSQRDHRITTSHALCRLD